MVLACGGFEANAAWRARYLGGGWDLAKVRGTRFNQGDGIRMALEAGAMPAGNWSGCHAVAWDRNAPEYGDLAVGDGFQKHSYPFSIVVNALQASVSSTRARIFATTPTPPTAAGCWSSPARWPGRSSTRR